MSVLRFIRNTAIDLCLGCRHGRLTRPFTIEDECYMVCLDCGRQLFYSAESMRRLSGRELRRKRAARPGGLRMVPQHLVAQNMASPRLVAKPSGPSESNVAA